MINISLLKDKLEENKIELWDQQLRIIHYRINNVIEQKGGGKTFLEVLNSHNKEAIETLIKSLLK